MTLVSLNNQRDITHTNIPAQTGFNIGQGGTQTSTKAATQTQAQTPVATTQATTAAHAGSEFITPGSYTYYLERGDRNLPSGESVATMAQQNAERLQDAIGPRQEQVNQALERVRADPTLAPATRDSLQRNLVGLQRDLEQAGEALGEARENYQDQSSPPDVRRALSQTSSDAHRVIQNADRTVFGANQQLQSEAAYRQHQAQTQAARAERGQAVSQTVAGATDQAQASDDPGQTLAAADTILALRSNPEARTSYNPEAPILDNRRPTWDTGATPLTEIAGQVQTLHETNVGRREDMLTQLDARAQEAERANPGSTRVSGSQAWEYANLATNLRAAAQDSDQASDILQRNLDNPGHDRLSDDPLPRATSRGAEAVAFEARVQRDAQQALAGPGEDAATNLAQAHERVLSTADTFAGEGATTVHGRATIEAQGDTMADIVAARQTGLRALDQQLAAHAETVGGPAPGEAGSMQGEVNVLRAAIGQEQDRLGDARRTLSGPESDSSRDRQDYAEEIASEARGASLRYSDGLQVHAGEVLQGRSGIGNAAVTNALPADMPGEFTRPNAAQVWVEGRNAERTLTEGAGRIADLPELAAQLPETAFARGGRYANVDVERSLNEAQAAVTTLDGSLDPLETGRVGEGEMRAAQRGVMGAGSDISAVNRAAGIRDAMMASIQENATVAQTNPAEAARRSETGELANAIASGAPDPVSGRWSDYMTITGGASVDGPNMETDLAALNRYTDQATRFVDNREAELKDRQQRSGDADGSIARELETLSEARTQLGEARASLETAGEQRGSDPARAGQEMFGASVNLDIAAGRLDESVDMVRSEPR